MKVAATGGDRVSFWGAATSEGTCCFQIYSENTNSDVLDNHLIFTVQLYQIENDFSTNMTMPDIMYHGKFKQNFMNWVLNS